MNSPSGASSRYEQDPLEVSTDSVTFHNINDDAESIGVKSGEDFNSAAIGGVLDRAPGTPFALP